jgi:hypothetical protein
MNTESESTVIVLTVQNVLGRQLHIHLAKVIQNKTDRASGVHESQITLVTIVIRAVTYFTK